MAYMAETTNYPGIFEGSYWGNFKLSENEQMRSVITARNEFVENFQIVSRFQLDLEGHCQGVLDHVECYETRSGQVVMVTSPYNPAVARLTPFLEQLGFEPHAPLYSSKASTFIRRFRNRNHMGEFFRTRYVTNILGLPSY